MAEALKSTVITNLDAVGSSSLPAMASMGSGGVARLHVASGYVTATTGQTGTYQLVRVRSDVKLKHVFVGVDATVTTFTCDIGFYYSTAAQGVDGTVPANAGTQVNTTSGSQLLGAAVDLKTAGFNDRVALTPLSAAKREQPLWQACGLTVDPGGYFDLVLTTTATNSGAPVASAEVQYVR